MLARLQQAITLGLVVLALALGVGLARAGLEGWAVLAVACVLFGHAAILGVEFLLLARHHGDDPAPRAHPAQLVRAWWGESVAAPRVFCWRQPFASARWPDHLPAEARGRRGVLLVHGFVCNRGLWNRWLQRLRAAGVPVVAVNLEPVFGSIDDYVAAVEQGVRALERCTGVAPIAVGHSMGGLVLRRWWAAQGAASAASAAPGAADAIGAGRRDAQDEAASADPAPARLHLAITLGTPHHGTWLARWALSPNARQMRRDSRWLHALAASEPAGRHARFVCFYSHCDNIVFPPSTATLPGADNRHLEGVAHVAMADHPEPWIELERQLGLRPA